MLPYIVGLLLFLTTYKRVNLFLIRRFLKKSETLPILNGAEPFFLDVGVPTQIKMMSDFLTA